MRWAETSNGKRTSRSAETLRNNLLRLTTTATQRMQGSGNPEETVASHSAASQ